MNLSNIGIIFVDKDKKVISALKKHFKDLFNVQIVKCNISQISEADCIVCPGNSYGIMNEGSDRIINTILDKIDKRVQNVIYSIYYGEQPRGSCILLETYNNKYKYLAHTPVTRMPNSVCDNNSVYYGFRALLTTILNHNKVSDNKIRTILCTCFGTGSGEMKPDDAARQMRLAYGLVDISLNCSVDNANIIDKLLN